VFANRNKQDHFNKMKLCNVLTVLAAVAGLAASFEIKTSRPKNLAVDEGGSMELFCTVDGYFEWCTFKRQVTPLENQFFVRQNKLACLLLASIFSLVQYLKAGQGPTRVEPPLLLHAIIRLF
jgi:hypothetical protein